MPRELTHWYIADSVYRALPAGGLKTLLSEHYPLYMAGAVLYDSPYCYPFGSYHKQFNKGALQAHGKGFMDTWEPFKRILPRLGQDERMLILTAGALTHLMTDSTFHPFVYYYTGECILKHFYLESLLDEMVVEQTGGPIYTKMNSIIGLSEGDLDISAEWMTLFFGTGPKSRSTARRVLKLHALTQTALMKFNWFFAGKGSEFRPLMDQAFTYRNPVSGVYQRDSIESLLYKSVSRSLNLLGGLVFAVKEGWTDHFFEGLAPLSALTGLHPEQGSDFLYQVWGERPA